MDLLAVEALAKQRDLVPATISSLLWSFSTCGAHLCGFKLKFGDVRSSKFCGNLHFPNLLDIFLGFDHVHMDNNSRRFHH